MYIMARGGKINILVVDDQPAKLLSLQAILDELDENVVQARSAEEALKVLLSNEVAVVLVDVCMPRMDGFELAELIRGHPRFKRTAIIFISAVHLTDADRLRGYGLGAVDYIPVPIIPEVLRAKVAVFADLYRKSEELEQLNRNLELRVAQRTSDLEASNARLRDTERRYRELVHALPAAVYTCDAEGRITLYNQAAKELWGCEPVLDQDLWCGSVRILRPDGSELPLGESAMAIALREGRRCGRQEVILERADGSRRNVLPNPEPILDASGAVVGAVDMLLDITEHKAAREALRESEDKFRTLADNMAQLAWMADAGGAVFWVNRRWSEYTGQSPDEAEGRGWMQALHPEHSALVIDKIEGCFRSGEAWEDTFLTRSADGAYRWFLCRAFPTKDNAGRVLRWFGTGTDVTEQREAQQVLARDRESLEALVQQRTSELASTNERLRMADRMATIGTLSTGLGHDMANLLLPVRMRLEAIDMSSVSEGLREDLKAIGSACEYLQRLSKSLRLLALDPEHEDVAHAETDVPSWWDEAEGMIRNGVPRSATLSSEIVRPLPAVRLGKAGLTQIVFNLVQNAGDALVGRSDGRVVISARDDPRTGTVCVCVRDNGPGMDPQTRLRCVEPFFTTKARGMSTGLGLALVAGILKRAHGHMEIESELGRGTEFRIILPTVAAASWVEERAECLPVRRAVISLSDRRLGAYLESVLTGMSYRVRHDVNPGDADVWITTSESSTAETIRGFTSSAPGRRAVVLDAVSGPTDSRGVHRLDSRTKPSQLSARIRELLSDEFVGTTP
jgi:PAS domain S-box-containing protein